MYVGATFDREVPPLPHEQGRVRGSPLQARKHPASHHFHRLEGAGEREPRVLRSVHAGQGGASLGDGNNAESPQDARRDRRQSFGRRRRRRLKRRVSLFPLPVVLHKWRSYACN
ncbi:uncharacterized protein M6B38_388150 [Iris pallida]|uniref:Uncharacterized protein n=1 Tax=Iris pallida TaxID=29817 RepID=A0AAX6G2F5_IRIPA|nr:uncharacterized protein M6B38_388150 [Iris pallida]